MNELLHWPIPTKPSAVSTGRSRGFAFVEMSDGAEQAIANLNGAQFGGRTLTVNEAKPREDRERSGSGSRGGFARSNRGQGSRF